MHILLRGKYIDKGNKKVIPELIELIKSSQNEEICRSLIEFLGKIAQGNEQVIAALVELIKSSQNEDICRSAIYTLGKIAQGNEQVITALIELIQPSQNEYIRCRAASFLIEINPNNQDAILTLVELINSSQNEDIYLSAISALQTVEKNNEKAIAVLLKILQSSQYEMIKKVFAAETLVQIGQNNNQVITSLIEFIGDYTNDEFYEIILAKERSRLKDIKDLDSIPETFMFEQGNEEAIFALIELIQFSLNENAIQRAKHLLQGILQKEQMEKVVTTLKNTLFSEADRNYDFRDKNCYTILWQCAQTLSYPEFYKAWHNQPAIPEVSPLGDTEITKILDSKVKNESYLVTIKTQNLNSIIEQKDLFKRFKNRLIDAIPKDIKLQIKGKIQESQDIADLEAVFIDLKELLHTENIALILGNDKPSQLLQEFCEQLSDFVQIDWNR